MDQQYVLIGLLIFVVGVVLIAVIDAYRTRDILGAYARLIERLTSNPALLDATEREYLKTTGARRAAIDTGLDAVEWFARLTPDQRDDVLIRWVEQVRDGLPNTPQPPAMG
jgi:hypothetical protein